MKKVLILVLFLSSSLFSANLNFVYKKAKTKVDKKYATSKKLKESR